MQIEFTIQKSSKWDRELHKSFWYMFTRLEMTFFSWKSRNVNDETINKIGYWLKTFFHELGEWNRIFFSFSPLNFHFRFVFDYATEVQVWIIYETLYSLSQLKGNGNISSKKWKCKFWKIRNWDNKTHRDGVDGAEKWKINCILPHHSIFHCFWLKKWPKISLLISFPHFDHIKSVDCKVKFFINNMTRTNSIPSQRAVHFLFCFYLALTSRKNMQFLLHNRLLSVLTFHCRHELFMRLVEVLLFSIQQTRCKS